MESELPRAARASQFRRLEILRKASISIPTIIWASRGSPAARSGSGGARRRRAHGFRTGSRLLSGNARAWEELEEEFAQFIGAEAALFFGSGYAANIGLLSSVIRKEDVVFSDSANHASIIDGIRYSGREKGDISASGLGFPGK